MTQKKSTVVITYEDAVSNFKNAVKLLKTYFSKYAASHPDFSDRWQATESVIQTNLLLLNDSASKIDLTKGKLIKKEEGTLGLNETKEVKRRRSCNFQIWHFGAIAIKLLELTSVVNKQQAYQFKKLFQRLLITPTMDLSLLWLQLDHTKDTAKCFKDTLHEAGTGGKARNCDTIYANISTIISAFIDFEIKHTPGLVPRFSRSLKDTIKFFRDHWCCRTRLEFNVRLHHKVAEGCDRKGAMTPTTVTTPVPSSLIA